MSVADHVHTALLLSIQLAVENVACGGGPFGAVIISPSGEVVATGVNRVTLDLDPTAHAEVCAMLLWMLLTKVVHFRDAHAFGNLLCDDSHNGKTGKNTSGINVHVAT